MSSAQPQNILVVEYEPRWADRVRDALVGLPVLLFFVKDGEEAMHTVNSHEPKLIILSSVVPKISAPDLIRAIRGRPQMQKTPILLTVSGYKGSSPRQDAARIGASDILPKPYTEEDLLEKVQQMLGFGQLTSREIFGDLLKDEPVSATAPVTAAPPATAPAVAPTTPAPKKPAATPKDDVDKMLEQTLASVMTKKRDPSKPKTSPGITELDRRTQDTLSGLEKSVHPRRTSPGSLPSQRATLSDKVPIAQPVFPSEPEAPVAVKEEEPTDGIRFGQYVLIDKIASGGMAEVWKARMRGVEGFQKIVAIKKILPHLSDNQEFIEMFVDEAKLAAQLNHSNIIHIYDLGKISNSYYIAMEYVDGHDLKAILKRAQERDQPMMVEVALFVASKLAAALDYAHRKRDFDEKEMGLVHRDVSPQNVLISHEGDIKLCDFGIAKAASKASHTQVGALKGKLQYMSPEQASGKAIDRRSDIFALGTVLFEMLTARKLFTGESEMSILEQVREARVTPPSQINSEEVTPEIDRVVLKALEKDPAARYQTAGEMARDLDSILYNFKPTPTSADLAIYMHHLWIEEPAKPKIEEPEAPVVVDQAPDLAVAAAAAAPATRKPTTAPGNVAMPAWEARPSRATERKRSPVVPLAFAAILVAGIVGAFFYVRSRGPAPVATTAAPAQSSPNAPAPAPVPATDSAAQMTQTTATSAPPPATLAPQSPVLDPNAINQEVQRRLAAERARLEQQSQAQAPAIPVTSTRPGPILQLQPPPQAVTQTVAPTPVPVTQTQAPAPPPTTTTPAAVTQTQPPPAAEAAPTAARVREGDLVPAGTEGLMPARIIRRGTVPYPPIARAQRIQGTVLLSVLVSETGQVLEVRILRGVSGVGLNEAAERIMRTSTFSPPTKDGVRVKAWTTVPVDFKL
jgi:TonB family protein